MADTASVTTVRGCGVLTWIGMLIWALYCTASQAADPLADLSDRYHRDRRRLITENLSLTASEARAFWPLYEEYERDLEQVTARRRAVIAEFGENFDTMSDAMAKKILVDRLKLEEERGRLRRLYLPRFERILPVRKLARYYQLESKIRAAVEAGIAEELPLIE
jgi:hypothetical protein